MEKYVYCNITVNVTFFLKFLFIYYFWLCWVFVSVRGLSPVAASGGHSSSLCAGLSLSRPVLLRSTGSRRAGSVVVAHGPNCSAACAIFPDQGSNPRPLHRQADSTTAPPGKPRSIFLHFVQEIFYVYINLVAYHLKYTNNTAFMLLDLLNFSINF